MSTASRTNNHLAHDAAYVMRPTSNDVLCGKDKFCVRHPGTKRFKSIIECYKERYADALTKHDKMTITKEIYSILTESSGSRFLKFNDLQLWEDLSSEAARDKIGHSLRFANRRKRRGRHLESSSVSTGSSICSNSSKETATTVTSSASSYEASESKDFGYYEPLPVPYISASMDNEIGDLLNFPEDSHTFASSKTSISPSNVLIEALLLLREEIIPDTNNDITAPFNKSIFEECNFNPEMFHTCSGL